jgi:hypothetical protein
LYSGAADAGFALLFLGHRFGALETSAADARVASEEDAAGLGTSVLVTEAGGDTSLDLVLAADQVAAGAVLVYLNAW